MGAAGLLTVISIYRRLVGGVKGVPAVYRYGGVPVGRSRSREGGKVGRELGDASQVADPGGDALTDEGNSGPAGEAKDGREGSGDFGGDGEGFPLAIFEGSGGAAEDGAAVAFDGKSSEPSGWEDSAGRDEKPTLVDAERDASRSKDAGGVSSNEIGYYASIDEEAGVINKGGDPPGGGATTGMVLDSDGESILNSEKRRLKANGVQEGPKGIPLLAPSGHVGNELPLAEERRGAALGILEPMELLRGEHSQTGVDEASSGESVETILIVQREEDKVIFGVKDKLSHPSTDLGPILNTDAELHGRKSGSNSIKNLGEGDAPNKAVPGVADAERTGAPVLLGNEDGPSAEPDLGAKLPGEHQVAEGGQ